MISSSIRGTTALLGLSLLLGSLAWFGCNSDQTAPDPELDRDGMSLTVDPLEDALAGSDGQVSEDMNRRVTRATEILGLSEAQVRALRAGYADFQAGLAELRVEVLEGRLSRDAALQDASALRVGFEAELQIILSEAQHDHLQQLRQLGLRQHRAHRDAAQRWANWMRAIGATPQQTQEVLSALHSLRDGIQELRGSLRDGNASPGGAYAAAQLLRADFDAALQEILSARQYELLRELRPDRSR